MKSSKMKKITGTHNHIYPKLSVARATLIYVADTAVIIIGHFELQWGDNINHSVRLIFIFWIGVLECKIAHAAFTQVVHYLRAGISNFKEHSANQGVIFLSILENEKFFSGIDWKIKGYFPEL